MMERARDRRIDNADEKGMTCLHYAAANGKIDCVKMLYNYNCNLEKKCKKGKTPCQYAQAQGHTKLVQWIEEELRPESSEDEAEIPEDQRHLNSTQRSKLKKRALDAAEQSKTGDEVLEEAGPSAAMVAADADAAAQKLLKEHKPVWAEITAALGGLKGKLGPNPEVLINRSEVGTGKGGKLDKAGTVDPVLWDCTFITRLVLRMPERNLTALPADLGKLVNMHTLILTGNGLSSLPDSLGDLKQLKVLQADDNALEALPGSIATLGLEVVNLSNNKLTDITALCDTTTFTSINVDRNLLTEFDIDYEGCKRLGEVSASGNQLTEVFPGIGSLNVAVVINFADNQITELPGELGSITTKKLQTLEFGGNPLRDKRCEKLLQQGARGMKDLLHYLKKQGKKGGSRAPKKKAPAPAPAPKAAEVSEDEFDLSSDEDEAPAKGKTIFQEAVKGKKGKGKKAPAPPAEDSDSDIDLDDL
jgi:leucine-rich repeat protein SHOC2